jgi:SAM-dependent methyltransferase
MLNLAAEAIRDAGLTNVETRVMDAANIELEADSFDAVMCRQGLMFFPEPVKALSGMRRVVKPGSRVVALVWSSAEKNPYHGLPLAIVRRIGNMPPPGAGQPGMFALGEPSILEGGFRAAGFLNIVIQAVPLLRRFASAAEAIKIMQTPLLQRVTAKLSETPREKRLRRKSSESLAGSKGQMGLSFQAKSSLQPGPNRVEIHGSASIIIVVTPAVRSTENPNDALNG